MPPMANNLPQGTRPMYNMAILNINNMAAVEKLSFTISEQITPIGIINGRIPSFQLANLSFFFTRIRLTYMIKANLAKSED
jgi:hypothetical protein